MLPIFATLAALTALVEWDLPLCPSPLPLPCLWLSARVPFEFACGTLVPYDGCRWARATSLIFVNFCSLMHWVRLTLNSEKNARRLNRIAWRIMILSCGSCSHTDNYFGGDRYCLLSKPRSDLHQRKERLRRKQFDSVWCNQDGWETAKKVRSQLVGEAQKVNWLLALSCWLNKPLQNILMLSSHI